MEEENYVIYGQPDENIPKSLSFSKLLLDSLKNGGNETAVIDGCTGKSVTYDEILVKSVNLATSLIKLGIGKGDVVSISSENRFEFTIVACAVFYLGGIIAPMNIMYKLDEIKHALNIAKPKFIFCSSLTIHNIKAAVENKFFQGIILFGNEKVKDTIYFDSLLRYENSIDNFTPTTVDPCNDTLVILYSSGTTGLAKGVMLTHRNVLISALNRKTAMKAAGLDTCDTVLFSLGPWSHAYGFVMHLILLVANYKLVFATKFEPKLYLDILQNQKVTIAMAVPPLVVFLGKHPLVSKYNLSSLQSIWCGAAPLSKDSEAIVKKRLNLKRVAQGYGMTETTLSILGMGIDSEKHGSVGKVLSGTKAKVVDLTTGKNLGPNETGELCFKGPIIMKGYAGDTISTNNIFDKGGWLHTGDVGYYDNDEYFYIVDRIKELIKYKGYQVAPAELEALLLQHEGVSDAGVVGLPEESSGELPVAFVVRQPHSTVSEEELVKFVASKVSPVKQLRGGVIFIQQMPRNPSGKILRRELKELLKTRNLSKL